MKYYTDFSEYADNAQPSDWTKIWDTTATWEVVPDAGSIGGKHLLHTSSVNARMAIKWDAIDADAGRADSEIAIRVKYPGTVGKIQAVTRASGALDNETGYKGGHVNDINFALSSYVNGVSNTIWAGGFTTIADTWYWIRFRVIGTNLYFKSWEASSAEPVDWLKIDTDSAVSAAGSLGILTTNASTYIIDVFSVGTNGDTAPLESLDYQTGVITKDGVALAGVKMKVTAYDDYTMTTGEQEVGVYESDVDGIVTIPYADVPAGKKLLLTPHNEDTGTLSSDQAKFVSDNF